MSILIKGMEHIPKGWRLLEHTNTEPIGYRWVSNCKSQFSEDFKYALVTEEAVNEWLNNTEQGNCESIK